MVIRADDLPAADRFEYWLGYLHRAMAPMKITCDDPGELKGRVDWLTAGAVHVSKVAASACEGRRTP
jgi:hypothetical protein